MTANLRRLCARVAHERMRAESWRAAAELRKITLARLRAGEPEATLVAELQAALAAALIAQAQARAQGE